MKVGESFYIRYTNADSKSNGKIYLVREDNTEPFHYLIDTPGSYVGGGRLLKKYCTKTIEIVQLFVEIPDEELRKAVIEIRESEANKFIKEDGLVRKYSELSTSITGVKCELHITVTNLLAEAAFRWVG